MQIIHSLIGLSPLIALFVTVALGYTIGKLKFGSFVLGGIAGTLLVGVAVGQFGISYDAAVKNIFFALFIYAVGFQGGPQFFRALNLRSLSELISAVVMCVAGLLVVLLCAWLFGLDRGTAAGLAAGGLTQSAIIGTAGDAISRLDVTTQIKGVLQANIAVGYAVCYIFGSLGPIIMVTWFFPTIMKWDVPAEAKKLAEKMSGGRPQLAPGQYNAAKFVDTRFYTVGDDSKSIGRTPLQIDLDLVDAAVEAVFRGGAPLKLSDETKLEVGDLVAVTGMVRVLEGAVGLFGKESTAPAGFQLVEENRTLILANPRLAEKDLQTLHDSIGAEARRGVFLTGVRRMGRDLPLLLGLKLNRGDELQLTGSPQDLDRIQSKVGHAVSAAAVTDFVFFGLGMTVGLLIGLIEVKIGGVPVSVGSGGGCLLSGLAFGWLRGAHPRVAALPMGASNFLKDFGLAVFVAIVGITAGPQVLVAVKQHGLLLFFLGVGVTIVPQIVGFYFSYYVLGIRNPIEALACVVGGRSANPGFAALLDKAGNATPVVTFTVTYAVANVLLTLWGPLIIGIVTTNPA